MVTTIEQDPSIEQVRPYSYFNDSFDRADGTVHVPSTVFNDILHALEGIQAINGLLISNEVAKANPDGSPFSQFIVGGLESATRALSNFSIDAMERVIDCHEKARHEANHE